MSVKSNGVQFSYTKTLFFVALVAWSATSVVTARSAEGAIRGLQVLGKQNAGQSKVSIKRYLRSNAEVTLRDRIGNSEERANFTPSLSSLAARLKTSLSTFIEKIQFWWWDLWRNSPKFAFDRLKLGSTGEKLFESPAFMKWYTFLKSKHPKSATNIMFEILADHYKNKDVLVSVLIAGTKVEQTKSIAEKLLDIQFEQWTKMPNTSVNEILKLLKLTASGDNIFENPLLYRWVDFINTIMRTEKRVDAIVYINLASAYNNEEQLADVIAKGVAANNALAIKLNTIQKLPKREEYLAQAIQPRKK